MDTQLSNIEGSSLKGDFRTHLQNELVKRCRRNPSYSLRAFAQSLEVHHAMLSLIIRNKRTLTPVMIERLGKKLNLSPQTVRSFVQSSPKVSQYLTSEDLELHRLTTDQFEMISDSVHDAIIELTHVKGFVSDTQWISKVLDVNVVEIQAAIDRLIRLGFLKKDRSGNLKDGLGNSTNILDEDFTNVASRKYQKSVLAKSIVAVESIPKDERDHSSIMMAISAEDLPKAKKIIKDCRQRLMSLLQVEGTKFDSVYQFSFSAFPVAKVSKKRKTKHAKM
jgi:uncharacterized protein (TIGR02147 family)